MGQATDRLSELAYRMSALPPRRELDALLSVGESISCARASIAVHELGSRAVSLSGAQAGILTDGQHGNAQVRSIDPHRIIDAFDDGAIVLVTGFQGISGGGDVMTLGGVARIPPSAVALAAALGVAACDIFTDVPDVFTADPRVVPDARKLESLQHEQMLEMAQAGATVPQPSAVELAMARGIDIHLRSSFSADGGTWIRTGSAAEGDAVTGIAHRCQESLYRVRGVSAATASASLRRCGAAAGVVASERDEVRCTAPEMANVEVASVVSAAIAHQPTIIARALAALDTAGIRPRLVTTTPGRVTAHISTALVDRAVRLLHDVFIPQPDLSLSFPPNAA